MKILQINTRYKGGGGAAEVAGNLHRSINKTTLHESTFLYGRGEANDDKAIYIGNKLDVYASALSFRTIGKQLNMHFDSIIEKYIKESDIVHLHNLHGYYIDYRKLISLINKYDKKVVWTFHDVWPITGRCAFSFGCQKWTLGCGNCPNKHIYPKTYNDLSSSDWNLKKKLFNSLNKDKTVLVTPSNWLKDMIGKSYLSDYRVEVINNGVEKPEEIIESKAKIRARYNIDKEAKMILFVAADPNDERKGIKHLLDIIPKMPEYTFASLGKKVNKLNYPNLIQLGYISDRNEINKIYYMSDVYIITSIEDNFPTTVLEAFSNKTPVIGFNTGGIREQIDDECGILVKKLNSHYLLKSIKEYFSNKCKTELSKNVYEKFLTNYQVNDFINKYIEIYRNN